MSSKLGVENIAHTNGTNAMTISSGGKVSMTGHVLQVVSKTDNTEYNTSTSDFSARGTGLDLAITPSSTSSKILITINTSMAFQYNNTYGRMGIYRSISGGATSNNLTGGNDGSVILGNGAYRFPVTIQFLDSPSTTSAVTYSPTFGYSGGGVGLVYIGSAHASSCITLMEIGG